MFLRDGLVMHSASDLRAADECEWALARALDARLGRVERVEEPEDAMRARAGELGDEHERRVLENYRRRFGAWDGTRGVVEIDRAPHPATLADIADRRDQTLAALGAGADVVFQATFLDEATGFHGYADFIVREGDAYAVYDAKLARSAKTAALLQVAAYALELERMRVPVHETVHLILGSGEHSSHALRDVVPVLEQRMAGMRALFADRLADHAPIAWDAQGVRACGRCAACTIEVERTNDVLLVGGLRRSQRERLRAVGIHTLDELAASSGPVQGIGQATLEALRVQATMQRDKPDVGVAWRLLRSEPLRYLPEPSPGDIFFDFEGDPLWTSDFREWGIDYLFGSIVVDDDEERFVPFWAHDLAGERRALTDFLDFVEERRSRHPDLHVYHYAAYERTHLLSLCARHGVEQDRVDALLRDQVLVDLYPIVRSAVRISEPSYSLKRLEPLFMGARLRESDVKDGAASVVAYRDWTLLRDAGETEAAERLLAEIADYNRYDCVATLGLRDWLLGIADEPRRAPLPVESTRPRDLDRDEDRVDAALRARIADVPAAERDDDANAVALTAAALEYHRREDAAFWVMHYDRLAGDVEAWRDHRGVLVPEQAVVEQDWHQPERGKLRRTLRLTGSMAPGSRLSEGDNPFLLYDPPVPHGVDGTKGYLGVQRSTSVVRTAESAGIVTVVIDERSDGETWRELPLALAPAAPIGTKPLREAILEWAQRIAARSELPADPALDILRRQPPRIAGGVPADGTPIERILSSLTALDRSYLAVQGPPGSGKTFVGASVIAELVERGWKVGVVAQSHDVVEHLLERAIERGVHVERVAKRPKRGVVPTTPWTALETHGERDFLAQPGGRLVGGTAWTFANAKAVPRGSLDLLVVDEAGQYSLANTIAVSLAARRLLLLGDPQQLPQVSTGAHPEPIDESALGWLSAGRDVLPAGLGVFLEESWRMHPALCDVVSALSYEGRLRSREPEASERRLDGVTPGVHPEPVTHAGRSVESPEEAARVVELVRASVGASWHDPARGDRALTPADVIVVAPYNAQVERIAAALDAAGLGTTRVGTVDRFQGQEAVIAIVSLTASSADDAPRGIDFVLQRNRINVAISRAQWAAYVVHSPAIAHALPYSADGLAQLSAFLRLTVPHARRVRFQ